MLYALHDASRRALVPFSMLAKASAHLLRRTPLPGAPFAAAGWELWHRITKAYPRPGFDVTSTELDGHPLRVEEEVVEGTPFARLVRFTRHTGDAAVQARLDAQPRVLLCAPLSGHHATLLRDMVRALVPEHDVYVTDWIDAKDIPLSAGRFGLDDYVDHLRAFMRSLGAKGDYSVVAVCQPAVPALAATALEAAAGGTKPRALVLMGGPIDGRRSPTEVNRLATERPLTWFESSLVYPVPPGHPGVGRRVYPGFLQLTAFVSMNPKRHAESYRSFWLDRVSGEHDKADAHERFYDDYNAVLDMDAEYYLETVRIVFQEHALPRGTWKVRGVRVDPGAITETALLTVEGAEDDITGAGQCHAAHELVTGVPAAKKQRFTAAGAGHYGIFSGRRFREVVHPVLRDFLAEAEGV